MEAPKVAQGHGRGGQGREPPPPAPAAWVGWGCLWSAFSLRSQPVGELAQHGVRDEGKGEGSRKRGMT